MTAFEQIKSDVLIARKARDIVKATVLSTLIAELCRNTKEPTDIEVSKGIQKFIKNLEKSIEARTSPQLEEELKIISSYVLSTASSTVNIKEVIDKLVNENPTQFESVKNKPQNIGWFVGQAMKATQGKANPTEVKSYLESLF